MWSGPRNISTAVMRSFSSRLDTHVVDEPFYAVYLDATGLDHPMRDEVIRSQSTDWREVVHALLGPVPDGKTVFYQKHMTHHMIPKIGREWMAQCRSAFLIRDPGAVLASYAAKRESVTLADIGIANQRELFEREAERIGAPPPVVEGNAILEDPKRMLSRLCGELGIPYTDAMLSWSAGRHPSDGIWAPAWYQSVEQSTGFARPSESTHSESTHSESTNKSLPEHLRRIADAARPYYERLRTFRI